MKQQVELQEPRRTDPNGGGETALLRIGDLAQMTGKTVRTLHYYEELGLLHPVAHTRGGFRLYDQDAADRVRAIEQFQEIGMTLSDIQQLSRIWRRSQTGADAAAQARELLQKKLGETDALIARLSSIRRELSTSLAVLDFCRPCRLKPGEAACRECQIRGEHEHESILVDSFCV